VNRNSTDGPLIRCSGAGTFGKIHIDESDADDDTTDDTEPDNSDRRTPKELDPYVETDKPPSRGDTDPTGSTPLTGSPNNSAQAL
jgi:hypothetical protein